MKHQAGCWSAVWWYEHRNRWQHTPLPPVFHPSIHPSLHPFLPPSLATWSQRAVTPEGGREWRWRDKGLERERAQDHRGLDKGENNRRGGLEEDKKWDGTYVNKRKYYSKQFDKKYFQVIEVIKGIMHHIENKNCIEQVSSNKLSITFIHLKW